MTNFIVVDINSKLSNKDIFEIFSRLLPSFSWRMGDSDAQGTYVSGVSPEKVSIQCWTGENPMAFSLSFRQAVLADDEISALTEFAVSKLIPAIGLVVKSNIN